VIWKCIFFREVSIVKSGCNITSYNAKS
jgi:hypothetical protein